MSCEYRFGLSVTLSLALLTSACGGGGGGGGPGADGSRCELLEGDLVLSEFLSDPEDLVDPDTSVISDAPEWIEIFNASSEAKTLAGLTLLVAGSGDPREYTVNVDATLEAGGYFVAGGRDSEGFDFVDFSAAFQLANGGGVIQLQCGETLVDLLAYGDRGALPAPQKGTSLAFDGAQAPSALLNDEASSWCAGRESYDGANDGTPGEANGVCGFVACLDGGTERQVMAPAAGALLITEVYADAIGADAGKEWVEVYNASSEALDLNGIRLVNTATNTREATVTDESCLSLPAGAYAVIGGNAVTAENGGVVVDAVAPELLSSNLYNEESTLTLFSGSVEVDSAVIPDPMEGRAAFVGELTPSGNDSADSFCFSEVSGIFEGFGSPGSANGTCSGGTERCMASGGERDTMTPAVGELIISEVFANPSGDDGNKEYIELYATAAVDLNGLVITADTGTSDRSAALISADCLEVSAGTYVVIATGADPLTNGGLTADFVIPQGASYFFNGDGQTVAIELADGSVLDFAVIPSGGTGVAVSTNVSPPTLMGNDTKTGWCLEATTGLFDDIGSPGAAATCQ